jgi:acetyl esterase/lipase
MKLPRIVALLVVLAASRPGAAQPPKSASLPDDAPKGTRLIRDLAYVEGGHARQKLDLYLPPGDGPRPLVIWIHGGAFMYGDKADRPRALGLLDRGFAVASLNYRLSGTTKFPGPVEDCKAAVRWLRANAKTYDLDPDRFGAWGSSAGGYLVAMLGVTGETDGFDVGANKGVSGRVQCVVDEYGPTDFTKMDEQDKDVPGNSEHDAADSPESRLLGGPVQQNKDRAAAANPITYVTAKAPPILVIHGDRDPHVPYGQSVILVDALKKAGAPVTFRTVEGAGHGEGFGPDDLRAAEDFLIRHLKPGKR